jgi:hypothetical protein
MQEHHRAALSGDQIVQPHTVDVSECIRHYDRHGSGHHQARAQSTGQRWTAGSHACNPPMAQSLLARIIPLSPKIRALAISKVAAELGQRR